MSADSTTIASGGGIAGDAAAIRAPSASFHRISWAATAGIAAA
jgi:hypothetical protein